MPEFVQEGGNIAKGQADQGHGSGGEDTLQELDRLHNALSKMGNEADGDSQPDVQPGGDFFAAAGSSMLAILSENK